MVFPPLDEIDAHPCAAGLTNRHAPLTEQFMSRTLTDRYHRGMLQLSLH